MKINFLAGSNNIPKFKHKKGGTPLTKYLTYKCVLPSEIPRLGGRPSYYRQKKHIILIHFHSYGEYGVLLSVKEERNDFHG